MTPATERGSTASARAQRKGAEITCCRRTCGPFGAVRGLHAIARAVTGYGQDTDRARTRAAGFDLHLVKPIQIDELLTAIDAVVPSAPEAATAGT